MGELKDVEQQYSPFQNRETNPDGFCSIVKWNSEVRPQGGQVENKASGFNRVEWRNPCPCCHFPCSGDDGALRVALLHAVRFA